MEPVLECRRIVLNVPSVLSFLFIHEITNHLLPFGSSSLAPDAGSTASSTVCYYTEHQH